MRNGAIARKPGRAGALEGAARAAWAIAGPAVGAEGFGSPLP